MSDENSTLLEELLAAGTPPRLVARVALMIDEVDTAKRRKAADAARKRASRPRTSADIRGIPRTSAEIQEIRGQAYIEDLPSTQSQKGRKKVYAKHALPTDFALTESDKRHAIERGWTPDKLSSELARFRDHAMANSRKQADWHAAWRNWVTSPYQTRMNGHAANPTGKNLSDIGREMLAKIRDDEGDHSNRLL